MKQKVINILISTIFIISATYAQSLTLTVNTNNLDINDLLHLTINIPNIPQGGTIDIPGLIENFDIVSQAQSQSIQVINGKKSANTQLQIQAKAKKQGEFTVGPVQIQIGTGIIQSNTVKVKVSGEKLFVNGAPSGRQNNPQITPSQAQNSPSLNTSNNTIKQKDSSSKSKKNTSSKKIKNNQDFSIFPILLLAGLLIIFVLRRQRRKNGISPEEKENRTSKSENNALKEHNISSKDSKDISGISEPSESSTSKSSKISETNSQKSLNSSEPSELSIFQSSKSSTYQSSEIFISNPQKSSNNLQKSPPFPKLNSNNYPTKLEQRIRQVIAQQLGVDTSSLTFEELHNLRAKAHGKTDQEIQEAIKNDACLLNKILKQLEQIKYAEKEIDLEQLHELAKEWKKSIRR